MTADVDALARSFALAGRAVGWDTHLNSAGRCWFIAAAWARRLYEAGVPYEMLKFENPSADHPADLNWNFVRTEGDQVWSWASRGGHEPDAESAPWPRISPMAYYLDLGLVPVPVCAACGKAPHAGDDCAPPAVVPIVATRMRR